MVIRNDRKKYNNFVGAIIAGAVTIGTLIATSVITNKNNQKAEIRSLMEEFVVPFGYSLEDMKNMAPKLYKKNKKYFEEEYNMAIAEYNAQKNSKENFISDLKSFAKPILIIAIIAMGIYYVINQ